MARPVNEINAGSMADIAFLLLIFFLVTTTMDVDSGIIRRLPPPPDPTVKPPDIKERNVINVLVNSRDALLVERQPSDIKTLRRQMHDIIANFSNREDWPEKRLETIEHLGEVWVSRGIVSLKNDRGTSYNMYIQVQNELTSAFNDLRNEMAMEKFGLRYSQLPNEWKEAVNKAVPVAISEAEPEDVGGK
ncbi:MAG: biopolymer transporter ExbD [Bacteroidales bacterium]|nr:biopolymer transporter ExbD [Bacteroidales bacterium]MDZ4205402.1 biopolymer transporter ExbD [Bacteroidales bacterium]